MMNREILFRGKRVDNGEWVYGDLTVESCGTVIHFCENGRRTETIVISKTVGQYTGLKDKSGKKIFEGDIIADFDTDNRYVVEWEKETACFILNNADERKADSFSGVEILDCWDIYNGTFELDVIGNIHDNSELLKG